MSSIVPKMSNRDRERERDRYRDRYRAIFKKDSEHFRFPRDGKAVFKKKHLMTIFFYLTLSDKAHTMVVKLLMKGEFILQRMYDYSPTNQRMMYRDSSSYYRQSDRQTRSSTRCCIQPEGAFPQCTPVAMAFVPFQENNELYDDCKALERGTAFPCLDKPFLGGGCKC